MDPSDIRRLFVIALVLYGTSLHELAHAYVATWFGDPTPGRHGRLTLNPIPHLQPVLTAIILPVIIYLTGSHQLFCLALTPIDPSKFRRPLRDHALVAVAGPVMNLLLMFLLIGILWIPGQSPGNYIAAIFPEAALWNLILAAFNLMPIPGLDGYWIVRPALPMGLRKVTDDIAKMGMLTLAIAMVVGGLLLRHFYVYLVLFLKALLP